MNPNNEQLKAITHKGGVLLKAGAGSGKTFVLVEHILFQITELIKNHQEDTDLYRSKLREFLKSTVLMTFTNKAAGEIKARLKKRINSMEATIHWDIAREEIDILKATTIHGFFYSLIREGLTPNIPSDLNIVSEEECIDKIQRGLNNWLTQQDDDHYLIPLMVLKKSSIAQAMSKVFFDAELRFNWRQGLNKDFRVLFDQAIKDLFELEEINQVFTFKSSLDDLIEYEKTKWFIFMREFLNRFTGPITNTEQAHELFNYLSNLEKAPRRPAVKKNITLANIFFDGFAQIKKLHKKLAESLSLILDIDNEWVPHWQELLESLFNYTEEFYQKDRKISFSDIEYLLLREIEDPAFIELVSSKYSYFIIDEFQDTSNIQAKILKTLAQNDFNRFFCIGDIKQAIYGFRGGEIAVFEEFEDKVPQVLTMANNYRSSKEVIEFNNHFFQTILPLGVGFENQDFHQIHFDSQTVPDPDRLGEITVLTTQFSSDEEAKLSSEELDEIESQSLFLQIQSLIQRDETIAVLYKKLKPSKALIKKFIQTGISFTAQVKLPLASDPIIGLFKVFISKLLDQKDNDEVYRFYLESYLALLNKPKDFSLDWSEYTQKINFYPLDILFKLFLNHLGISTSLIAESLESVNKLITTTRGELEGIFEKIESLSSENYSFAFKYGSNPDSIQIMTTHASKGLEFDHVLLGGIYTNGRGMPNTDLLGSFPGSYKLIDPSKSKKSYPTPVFTLEQKMRELKEFSENKRLLYVACTRAKECLYWVNLDLSLKKTLIHKNSWVKALNLMLEEGSFLKEKTFKIETQEMDRSLEVPLFHHIDLGISTVESKKNYLLSELSVTRLTMAMQCPRMFYFANILKIQKEEIEHLQSNSLNLFEEVDQEEDFAHIIRSNANRGTEYHGLIEYALKHNFTLPRKKSVIPEGITWTLNELKAQKEHYHFISEEMVKFEIFGYMISGIPDLILQPKDNEVPQVIDFKTGAIKEDNDHYWYQLYAYAHYLFQKMDTQAVKLKLMYIDEQKTQEQIIQRHEALEYLQKLFELTTKPFQTNLNACLYCAYGNICHRP